MGSYLEINGKETNSKSLSKVLINVIRELDSKIKSDYRSSEKQRKWFMAEKYEEGYIGYGDYVINKKGMALLAFRLDAMKNNDELLEEMGVKEHEYYINNLMKDDEVADVIKKYTEEVREEVKWCYNYVTNILIEMELNGIKKVDVCWV